MKKTLVLWDIENLKGEIHIDFHYQLYLVEREHGKNVTHVAFMGDFTNGKNVSNHLKEKLTRLGVIVNEKTPKSCSNRDGTTYLEVDMDAEITTYMLTNGLSFNNIVMVSGDGDMEPALSHLKDKGKDITVFSLKGRLSNRLKKFKTRYITALVKEAK